MLVELVNIHEAKTRLSKLVARAQEGESFVIGKAGRPLVRVTAIDSPEPSQQKRIGFLAGQGVIPDEFDRLGEDQIAEVFGSAT